MYDIGSSYEGRPMKVLGITRGGKGAARERTTGKRAKNVFFEGGLHSREWIAITSTTYLIKNE